MPTTTITHRITIHYICIAGNLMRAPGRIRTCGEDFSFRSKSPERSAKLREQRQGVGFKADNLTTHGNRLSGPPHASWCFPSSVLGC